MGVVKNFMTHYEPIVVETLESLSTPDQSVYYSVDLAMAMVRCEADNDHYHEVPALSVMWTVQEGLAYDIACLAIPLVPEPVKISTLQDKILECWETMTFERQASDLSELDQAMDAIADGDDPL